MQFYSLLGLQKRDCWIQQNDTPCCMARMEMNMLKEFVELWQPRSSIPWHFVDMCTKTIEEAYNNWMCLEYAIGSITVEMLHIFPNVVESNDGHVLRTMKDTSIMFLELSFKFYVRKDYKIRWFLFGYCLSATLYISNCSIMCGCFGFQSLGHSMLARVTRSEP
jgi:hypothetical protein